MAEQPQSLLPMQGFASIHGLFVPDELLHGSVLVELEPGLEICQLDGETEGLMYQTETIRRVAGFRWSDHYFAVRVRFDAPVEGEARQGAQRRANRLIGRVLECLRLFQSGQLNYGSRIQRLVSLSCTI